MKTLWTMVLLALAAQLAACASTEATAKPTLEDMAARLNALEQENAALRQQAAAPVPMIAPEDMTPPPARFRSGPPQNWAWLHTPPQGCSGGVYALEITNRTDFFVDLMIDGEALKVRGSRGLLPGIPPHEKAYACLAHTGIHNFTGELLALRYGRPERVGTYQRSVTYNGRSVRPWNNFQEFGIEDPDPYVTWSR